MKWARHIARVGTADMHTEQYLRKLKKEISCKSKLRYDGNIKTDHKEKKCVVVEWNYQIPKEDKWLSVMNTVTNIRILLTEEGFMKSEGLYVDYNASSNQINYT